ncbi:MAG: hypothetical protein K8E66_07975, partial [Phycisphaerales bacterium]|nr:hypothetical protein [Phycisphaerales bacterium]
MRRFMHIALLGTLTSAAAAHTDATTSILAQRRHTDFVAETHRLLATPPRPQPRGITPTGPPKPATDDSFTDRCSLKP